MWRRPLLALAILLAGPAAAQGPPPRVELPLREVTLSDGMRRYALSIEVAGRPLQAGLDTGSTGLRLMPRAGLPEPAVTRRAQTYAFGAGVRLDGVLARQPVRLGALEAPVWVEQVREIGCVAAKPDCAARRAPREEFGIQGDGLRGEGFPALLGINMGGSDAENPLTAAGVRRWIVELPRPGEDGDGRLILNPDAAETAGYVFLPVLALGGGLHDALRGCLVRAADQRKVCGAVLLDTGAPGLRVRSPDEPWPDAGPAVLVFAGDDGRPAAAESLVLGRREHASHLSFDNGPGPPAIYAGLSPYFAFSVLYDPAGGRIGLKPRPPAPGAPRGEVQK